jgi:transcriptional regulator with XRE-family HTH domain
MTAQRKQPEAQVFGNYLDAGLRRIGMTRRGMADQLGCTDRLVSLWCQGRGLPTLRHAEAVAAILNDNRILAMLVKARTRRCALESCGKVFTRTPGSKRLFCSIICRRQVFDRHALRRDPRQDAIDDMCRGCEPDGICRTGDCPLRGFSPFPFVAWRVA